MDLTKILKVGDRIYSPLGGYGEVLSINHTVSLPIKIRWDNTDWSSFTKEGKYYTFSPECLLFPSKENRDWNTWKTKKECPFKPFDKVLARNATNQCWNAEFFSDKYSNIFYCIGGNYAQCIPYNKETEHLVGTNLDCPDKYKIG